VFGTFAVLINMFLFRALVSGEEISLFIGALISYHVHKTIGESNSVTAPTNLKDIDAVPQTHAPAFLRRWKIIEAIREPILIIETSGCALKNAPTLFVDGSDRELMTDTNTNAQPSSTSYSTKSARTN